jgi:NADH:ubiquinone reductase (H+-translocating)
METHDGSLKKKHIIVVGGGFAGLNFAQRLFNNRFYAVTLIDKNNYNYFTPLLYQVATSFLEPSSISYPFRKLFKDKGIAFHMATVTDVDPDMNTVHLSDGVVLRYDYLVFAAGAKTNFFGNETIQRKAFALKDMDDALYIRNKMIGALEKAACEKDPVEQKRLLRIVIAGGGPTGVELAGMLAEMKDQVLREYPEIDPSVPEIYIVDALPYLLAPMSDKTHDAAYRILDRLGVKLKLNTQVSLYDNGKVYLSDGTVIDAKTLVWAAGVTAHTFEGIGADSRAKGGRMVTDTYNRVLGYDNIFAIGDISIQFSDVDYPNGHPQLAQPAIQQGTRLAKNFLILAKGKSMKPFKYFDRGDMAIIGKTHAVADLFKKKLHIGGLLGLLSWLFIHLISLVNYNNKVKTLYNWAVAYMTSDQALRMIFRPKRKTHDGAKQNI